MPEIPKELLLKLYRELQEEYHRLQQENQELRAELDWQDEEALADSLLMLADSLPPEKQDRVFLVSLDLH
jgi:hypothetical protein